MKHLFFFYGLCAVINATSTANITDIAVMNETFRERESDMRFGGVRVHRVLEVDPLPLHSHTRTLSLCLECSEDLLTGANSNDRSEIKKRCWKEITALSTVSLLHPLCVRVLGECGESVSAEEALEFAQKNPFMLSCNSALLQSIKDYSLFTPEHVTSVFEDPLASGMNLFQLQNALKTLPGASLARLLELTGWDLEDWEMKAVVEARGGATSLWNDIKSENLNAFNLITRFPGLITQIENFPYENSIARIIDALDTANPQELFMAIVEAIMCQELLISANLSIYHMPGIPEFTRNILEDKIKLQEALQRSNDQKIRDLSVWARTPLAAIVKESQEKLNDLLDGVYDDEIDFIEGKSPEEILAFWKELVGKFFGDKHQFFYSGTVARSLIGMILTRLDFASDNATLMQFFTDNRVSVLHPMSTVYLKLNLSEMTERSELFAEIALGKFKKFAEESQQELEKFKGAKSPKESIEGWVSFQWKLQAAGTSLKRYYPVHVVNDLLPIILRDVKLNALLQEYPGIFLSQEMISAILQDNINFFTENPALLYNLDDYRAFTGSHFQHLHFDFSKVRRGMSTIPQVQLISFLKARDGVIDDPISFLASLSPSTWLNPAFAKHLDSYYRASMLAEEPDYGRLMNVLFTGVLNVPSKNSREVLWKTVKWAINLEIFYQELGVMENSNTLFRILKMLTEMEAFYRPAIVSHLENAIPKDDDDELVPLFKAAIKSIKTVPLSSDRFAALQTTPNSNLFPNLSTKSTANFAKTLQNFRMMVKKLAGSEESKGFWLFLLDICEGKWEELRDKVQDSTVPAYYRILLHRRLTSKV